MHTLKRLFYNGSYEDLVLLGRKQVQLIRYFENINLNKIFLKFVSPTTHIFGKPNGNNDFILNKKGYSRT